jgi:cysteinyl-tRNA synthetase, unknown class
MLQTLRNLPPNIKQACLALAAAGLLVVAWSWRDVPSDAWTYRNGGRPLAPINSWHYQLDKIDIDKLALRDADMLVTDYAREGGKIPLTRAEVTRLKTKPNGQRRTVISYLSIGEAEEFRFYWQDAWKTQKPSWLERENCAWPKAWMVRFWDPGWRDLIVSGPDAYLKRIIDAGFDGVYLDRIDMWEHTATLNPAAKAAMIDFVAGLAATARALKPGFIVIAQNAEDLLEDRRYRRMIDAIAKEELYYSRSGTGARNTDADITKALGHLRQLHWQWKPIFPVEYLLTVEDISATNREARRAGFVPVFPTRALDGGEPTAAVALEKEAGTPEFIKSKCPEGTSW